MGHFTYLYSDSNYTPVTSLNGRDYRIYFSGDAEKSILWRSNVNSGISNANSVSVVGYLSQGYKIKIEFADTLAVYQPHRTSSSSTKDAWAYYSVSVVDDDISTDLLYRTQRSNTIITFLIIGIVLLVLYTIFKMIRRER